MFYPSCKVFDIKEADVKRLFDNYLFDEYFIVGEGRHKAAEFSQAIVVNGSSKTVWDGRERIEKGDMVVLHTPHGPVALQVQMHRSWQFAKEYIPRRKIPVVKLH